MMAEAKNKKASKKSGNPAVRAAATPSSASDFKKNRGGLLTLPSGLTVKANRAGGMRAFVAAGNIPNSLMGIVDDALKQENGNKVDPSAVLGDDGNMDAQMLEDMLALTDSVVIQVVTEPKIHPVPEDEDDRDDDLVYIDEVDDEDKMFIFQWVTGGTSDVERFRQESSGTLDDLAGRAVAARSTE
jgi:hypothetical protein